jgi:hypothetical protein
MDNGLSDANGGTIKKVLKYGQSKPGTFTRILEKYGN